ncbi:MAG: nucleoside-diphosphate kinase [Thermoanaerobaculia bacterium]|nr:nucleoside-diphosphate kinase [Thermoanaerobaculia bacterium]
MSETTLTIIKPDSVGAGNAGKILAHLEAEGFKVRAIRQLRLTDAPAQAFYAVHAERPFFGELVDFMTSGPAIAIALEREDAVSHLRQVMGATNSQEAAEGTIRNLYGTDVQFNAIHGSDSPENAAIELAFFFSRTDLIAAS